MKNYRLSTITLSNGETMGYREAGTRGPALLLVHGNMSSSKHMEILMERLEADYRIMAVDMRGFGSSSYNHEINSLKDFSDDIRLFADAVNLKDFSIVGWSTGGGVALQFAADYPELVRSVVLIESVGIKGYPMFRKDAAGQPILSEHLSTKKEIAADPVQVKPVLDAYASHNKEYMRMLWNLVIYTHNKPEPQLYEEYLEDMMTQCNLVDVDYALVHFNMSNENNGVEDGSGLINCVQAPVLILQGDRDYVVPRQMAEETASALGNLGRLVILRDSGHSPLIDCMDNLVQQIRDFI